MDFLPVKQSQSLRANALLCWVPLPQATYFLKSLYFCFESAKGGGMAKGPPPQEHGVGREETDQSISVLPLSQAPELPLPVPNLPGRQREQGQSGPAVLR